MRFAIPGKPVAHGGHLMNPALPFAEESGAGFDFAIKHFRRAFSIRNDLRHELVELFLRFSIKPAKGFFTNGMGDRHDDQLSPHELRQVYPAHLDVAAPELIHFKVVDAGNCRDNFVVIWNVGHVDQSRLSPAASTTGADREIP